MARLFVAVWPPAEVLDLIEALPRVERPGVRWTPRPAWHVTLAFLGEADPDRVREALAALRSPTTEAVLGPRPGRLGRGVLVVPVTGLDRTAADVRSVTAGVSGWVEDRPFHGHLTLARLRGAPACGLTADRIEARWPVDAVALVESTPGPAGPVYTTLATVPLL